MTTFDVIVIGAGPAGVSAALECTQDGYKTLLLEKKGSGRHKPCGGVTPTLFADILEDEFRLKLPPDVMCSPKMLGLYYVPPSGRANGGERGNYKLLNLDRDRFDNWFCQTAEDSNVKVLYEAEFLEFRKSSGMIEVLIKEKEGIKELKSHYLIGADGVFSRVKKQLYNSLDIKAMVISQEYWRAKGEFGEFFYVFLKEDITPSYAYLIPKDDLFIIGTGVPWGYPISVNYCLDKFKQWLGQEFAFEPLSLERKEAGAFPLHLPLSGKGNVILIGDAAGFCNSFSGEGIRLAIESGIAAGEAITEADNCDDQLSSSYTLKIEGLSEFIRKTYDFSISLTDRQREMFVASQLKRAYAL